MSLFQKASKPVRLLFGVGWIAVAIAGSTMTFSDSMWHLVGLGLLWIAGMAVGHGATIEDQETEASGDHGGGR